MIMEELIDESLMKKERKKKVEFWAKKVIFEYSIIIDRNRMMGADSILESVIDFDTISENGRNIYEWNHITQTILDIDFDWTTRNEGSLTFWRLGISRSNQYSIFQNTFQYHGIQTTETTSFRIDGC